MRRGQREPGSCVTTGHRMGWDSPGGEDPAPSAESPHGRGARDTPHPGTPLTRGFSHPPSSGVLAHSRADGGEAEALHVHTRPGRPQQVLLPRLRHPVCQMHVLGHSEGKRSRGADPAAPLTPSRSKTLCESATFARGEAAWASVQRQHVGGDTCRTCFRSSNHRPPAEKALRND